MSTWWTPAHRADIGLRAGDFPGHTFNLTNRGWYIFYKLMHSFRARSLESMSAQEDAYISSRLARHWGELIIERDLNEWLQVGRFNGRSVVFAGVIHQSETDRYAYTCELTPLPETPIMAWLYSIGQELAMTPSGFVISGVPRKEHPMSVNLQKGGNVNLTKEAGGSLTNVVLGLGWDVRSTTGQDYDLDASAIVVGADGKVLSDNHFVFYRNLTSSDGSVEHTGDNLTGAGDGDDEQIKVNLAAMPTEAAKVVFPVSIYEAAQRGNQNFGQVQNAFIRVMDGTTGTELSRYDLTEDAASETVMVFGELYRHGNDWKFRAVGSGYANGLGGLAKDYGVNVS